MSELVFGSQKKKEELPEAAKSLPEEDLALTDEEKRQVDEFVKQIDITDSDAIMQYGSNTQEKLAGFSQEAIDSVRTKDMGEVGTMLASLVAELKSFDVDDDEKGIFPFLKKKANRVQKIKAKYATAEQNVDAVVTVLKKHMAVLRADSASLDKMYDRNLEYFHELTMYIAAGKKKLEEIRTGELAQLQAQAEASGKPEDAQKAKDLAGLCERFEKKLYDLELTRTIAIQTAPQIRMIQNNDITMAEKIQSTIVNTIPLWKNQMVIALGIEHAGQAAEVEKKVNDMTNDLLRKNADMLKESSIAVAKESQRGIVDIETLQHTNEALISSMDEIMSIQEEGRTKRAEAEKELQGIETQLKDKLLEMAGRGQK